MNSRKTHLLAFFIILLLASCSHNKERSIINIKKASFEKKQISRGDNSPNSIVYEADVDVLLVSMYYSESIEEIKEALGWDDDKMQETMDILLKEGMLSEDNGLYNPSIFVLPLKEGIALKKESRIIAKEISDSIIAGLDKFKAFHHQMDVSEQYSFNSLSFFYLSNILLDMGQIANVESLFLKTERPQRNGKNYYFSIMEKDTSKKEESFGIYGNHGLLNNDSLYIGVYGNTRYQEKGWDNYQNKELHCFSQNDYEILFNEFNEVFLPVLIHILEQNNLAFLKLYDDYGYAGKISFEEFFIWYYHLIYTEATNELINKKVILKPESGRFYYQIEK